MFSLPCSCAKPYFHLCIHYGLLSCVIPPDISFPPPQRCGVGPSDTEPEIRDQSRHELCAHIKLQLLNMGSANVAVSTYLPITGSGEASRFRVAALKFCRADAEEPINCRERFDGHSTNSLRLTNVMTMQRPSQEPLQGSFSGIQY